MTRLDAVLLRSAIRHGHHADQFPGGGPGATIASTEPADGDLAAGDVAFWYDDTAGSPTLHIKAKDSGGDVFGATIPLTAP